MSVKELSQEELLENEPVKEVEESVAAEIERVYQYCVSH